MKPATRIWCFIFTFLIFIGSTTLVFAEASPAELKQIEQKAELIESKIKQLKSVQTQILERQGQILTEISSLRIWIRRNRS